MSYVTPVTDRSITDILNKTSKAFWNVADWERVYGNARLVDALVEIMLDTAIQFDTLTVPTITIVPLVADFNTFLANIERIRAAVAGESIPGTETAINDSWQAGDTADAPDYEDANLWESTLDAIWDYWNGDSIPVCPILSSNLTVLTGATQIYIDCLDMADFNADLSGTARLAII